MRLFFNHFADSEEMRQRPRKFSRSFLPLRRRNGCSWAVTWSYFGIEDWLGLFGLV
jgi:hypothetical protein